MKLAIFDVDGTLTLSLGVDGGVFAEAFEDAFGFVLEETDWGSYRHHTDSGIALEALERRWQRPATDDELERYKACFHERLGQELAADPGQSREMPGASALLDELERREDWGVVLATGAWRRSAELKMQAAQLDALRFPAATGDDGISRVEILEMALERARRVYGRSDFDSLVSLGDGVWDIVAARDMDLRFVGVGQGEAADRLQGAGARRVLPDFGDLTACLNALESAEPPASL